VNRRRHVRFGAYAVLGGFVLFAIAPLAWMAVTSMRAEQAVTQWPPSVAPGQMTFENYRRLWAETRMPRYALNSMAVALATAALVVGLAAPAGYGFSRFQFPGSRILLLASLGAVMVSGMTTVVPLYVVFQRLGLLNNPAGLVLVNAVQALPLSLWIMKAYIDTVPRELDDLVELDGGTPLTAFGRVILPVTLPALTAVTLYGFIVAWREFLLAATFITRDTLKTLPVGILGYFTEVGIEWGKLAAATMVATVPAFILFWILQRWFVPSAVGGEVNR